MTDKPENVDETAPEATTPPGETPDTAAEAAPEAAAPSGGDVSREAAAAAPQTTETPPAAEPVSPATGVPAAEGSSAVVARADTGKRAVALVIDAVIAVIVGLIPVAGGIAATAYWLVRDGLDFEFMDHRSIGKKVMKLRPVTLDGRPVDIATSVKRNWMFALGGIAQFLALTIIGVLVAIPVALIAFAIGIVEIVLVVTDAEGRRIGDKVAGTRVIETDS